MELTLKKYDFLPPEALEIRIKVFVDEQGFCDEVDATDAVATHLVLFDGDSAVATCRIFKAERANEYILGRLCVLKEYRAKGVGRKILCEAERETKAKGGRKLTMHSQYQARDFYKKSGYAERGEMDYEQDCPHIWLEKEL